ncbi:Pentatricopeptide repeat-containing protein [Apostasia shenzhenica]|uniref:Pentatricopeptide repeat-containing protein n=1 Tax=Apostasia shenzhenica TaxID=1088818 RepID=A0A2I0BH99_9ASPA|nr:Pentatricopeptide repeat-containing protein [Apostasia shenzhenica]
MSFFFLSSFSHYVRHLPCIRYRSMQLQVLIDRLPFSSNSVGMSVISRCSSVTLPENFSSVQEILKKYGDLCPAVTRHFWRVSSLRPIDFLVILQGFEAGTDLKRVVGFLWVFFNWACKQNRDFQHLPKSYELMITMLIQCQMFSDAESFLLSSEAGDFFSNPGEKFSEIIRGYAEASRLKDAVSLYDHATHQGFILLGSCYQALLKHLIEMEEAETAVRVYMDMMKFELRLCAEGFYLDFVVGYLCKKGKTLDALNILRQVRNAGFEASSTAFNAIVKGYSLKKDFEDVLSFLKEWNYVPPCFLCNNIVSSICKSFGGQYAWLFVEELEALGFEPDGVTFEILIIHSCKERKMRDAFIYLSESFSHQIKLKVNAYNALIGGIMKEGMSKSAKSISDEMVERGILMDLSTCKTLLAGYCKHRMFDEMHQLLAEMVNSGLISLCSGVDPTSKAFSLLGLDHIGIKVKRDNDANFSKAEYFDSLGNGLYLETDNDKYEEILEQILDKAMNPDFDSLLMEEIQKGNPDAVLRLKGEIAQWNHHLVPLACSELLKFLCNSPLYVQDVVSFLDENSQLCDQLDNGTMNFVVQYVCKNGMVIRAMLILDSLHKRRYSTDDATYEAVITGFCKKNNPHGIQEFFKLFEGITYLSSPSGIQTILSCLCRSGMVKEMFLFFDNTIDKHPNLLSSFFTTIVNELSFRKLTSIAVVFIEEICKRFLVADHAILLDLFSTTCLKPYEILLHFLVRSGRIEEASLLKQFVLSKKINHANSIYSILMNEFCMMGWMKEASFLLEEMLFNRVFPDCNALNLLIHGFSLQRNLKKALEIMGFMFRNHVNLSICGYRSLVCLLCLHKRLNCALKLQKLVVMESESKSLIINNILICSLFRTNNILSVDNLLDDMQEKNLAPDSNTYNFLVHGYYKCGNVLKAVEVFYEMIHKGMRPNNRSLRTIICYFCSHGDLSKAIELSNMIVSFGWNHGSCVQSSLAMKLISCGKVFEAQQLLSRIEEKGLISECINYDLLIREFCKKGEVKKAVHLLNLMLQKSNLPSGTSYNSVIHGLCLHKSFDEALDFLEEMLHKGLEPNINYVGTLIYGLTDSSRTDEARRILHSMLQLGIVPTHGMYNYVIRGCYAESNMEMASEILNEMQQAGYSPNFETHWSLISNLSRSTRKDENDSKGFLSSLLSGNGPLMKNVKIEGVF